MTRIRRGFADIEEGQVHYHEGDAGTESGKRPLVMIHGSPVSSRTVLPFIRRLSPSRRVIAPDTLGNGHSSPPAPEKPDMAYLADAHVRALDTLGIEQFDLYGHHTGAKIGVEIAIAHPDRVGKFIIDGASVRQPDNREMLLSGIKPIEINDDGTHLLRAWHMVRDAYLFFPWWKHTAEARRELGLPDTAQLHAEVVDMIACIDTYHLVYAAAIGDSLEERLPHLTVPTLVAAAETDQLYGEIDDVAGYAPNAEIARLPSRRDDAGWDAAAEAFAAFLDS